MRTILLTGMLLMTFAGAQADVLEVNVWKSFPGKGAETFANGQKAKAIHAKHGAAVTVANDGMGRMHYALRFANFQAMNAFYDKALADPAWGEFWQAASQDPSAELVGHHVINIVSPAAKVGVVYDSYVWQPLAGKTGAMMQAAMEAQAIHQKAGAYVDVGFDKLQRLVYIMTFDDWAHYSKFQDTPLPDFEAFMQKQSADPSAVLVENYTGMAQQ